MGRGNMIIAYKLIYLPEKNEKSSSISSGLKLRAEILNKYQP